MHSLSEWGLRKILFHAFSQQRFQINIRNKRFCEDLIVE